MRRDSAQIEAERDLSGPTRRRSSMNSPLRISDLTPAKSQYFAGAHGEGR